MIEHSASLLCFPIPNILTTHILAGTKLEPCFLRQNNYINLTTHFALFGDYCHSVVLDKRVKTTRDIYGAYASAFQVNKLQTAADPFQPARATKWRGKTDARGCGKNEIRPNKGGTTKCHIKTTTKPPPASHHHT